ncbi:MAG: helix-turn-helix domain-containing protein [bacterium]
MWENLGPALAKLRRRRGMTLEMVAERTSVTRASIGFYETGKTRPSLRSLGEVMEALDVSLIELAVAMEDPWMASGDVEEGGAGSVEVQRALETRAKRALGELMLALGRFVHTTGQGVLASSGQGQEKKGDDGE